MIVVKILLGLAGLGIVIFVHELGHFLAARLMGIDVEAFAIGWGPTVWKKKAGGVEYRLGALPLGGYCKMRGENEFQEAWESRKNAVAPAKGTYLGAPPWRRVIVSVAGPFFNLVFAVLTLSVIWGAGFERSALENRIVLVSDVDPEERDGSLYPADAAGLRTGDRITSIGGRAVTVYQDIQAFISANPEETLPVEVERDGEKLSLLLRPALDKSTGAGRIGVFYWLDPVVAGIASGSAAEAAGLLPGDRILRVNGQDMPYTVAIVKILKDNPPAVRVEYERDGAVRETEMVLDYGESGSPELGISWKILKVKAPPLNPIAALRRGASETWEILALSFKSLTLLFRGVDLTQAVSGPVRITYMVGEAAAEGFEQSAASGLRTMANFLAFVSIALCVMNLLPLPILDGGMTFLFLLEWALRRPLHPRFIMVFQGVGILLIGGLMIFAMFGDIMFFARR